MADLPFVAAQSILTDAHLRENPTAETSITPSTSADSKTIISSSDISDHEHIHHHHASSDSEDDDVDVDVDDASSIASIGTSVLDDDYADSEGIVGRNARDVLRKEQPRLPPLPDLRFEQSYLAGIRTAVEQKKYWMVAFLTVRDQVVFPLLQGCLWNLTLVGWRFWNRGAKFKGASTGAKIRRWWW